MRTIYLLIMPAILPGFSQMLFCQSLPVQGDLIITEIMVNPDAVSDTNGEWFEIWNASDHDLALNGLIIKDSGSNRHILTSNGPLIISQGHYQVLARNPDTLVNGGVKADYELHNFTLNNTSDQVILCLPDETIVDQVIYSAGWPTKPGASMELDPNHLNHTENDLPENWYAATKVYGSGDRGTPGRSNTISTITDSGENDISLVLFPNPSQGRCILLAEFPDVLSGEIKMINVVGQDFIYKKFTDKQGLDEFIDTGFLSPGLWFLEVRAGRLTRIARLLVE